MSLRKETVAYHEAGHAVVAALVHKVFGQAVIRHEDGVGWVGATRVGPEPERFSTRWSPTRKREAVVRIAGSLAEAMQPGGSPVHGEGSYDDFRRMNDLRCSPSWSPEDPRHDRHMSEASREARRLLEANWSAVARVAYHLFVNERITAPMVRRIICEERDRSGGGPAAGP